MHRDRKGSNPMLIKDKQGNSCIGLHRPCGFQEVEFPRYRGNRHIKVVRLSALLTDLYPPGNISETHFCQTLSRPQGHSAAGRIPTTQSGIEPPTFRLITHFLNQLRHRVPLLLLLLLLLLPPPPPSISVDRLKLCPVSFDDSIKSCISTSVNCQRMHTYTCSIKMPLYYYVIKLRNAAQRPSSESTINTFQQQGNTRSHRM